ncbi:hypothetical protein [Actinomyces qiguomingii]|uniref:hypothetical protein n=1 Tax=Actinomyces qiguomingii TaxID=2057800 RepID=UPI000CA078EF|nr:hypothetical protein [Actinomyces qiguomingii]
MEFWEANAFAAEGLAGRLVVVLVWVNASSSMVLFSPVAVSMFAVVGVLLGAPAAEVIRLLIGNSGVRTTRTNDCPIFGVPVGTAMTTAETSLRPGVRPNVAMNRASRTTVCAAMMHANTVHSSRTWVRIGGAVIAMTSTSATTMVSAELS